MKAEERKELVTNDLARWVNNLIQHPKESIPARWYWIGGGILLVLVLVFVYRWAVSSSGDRDSNRWAELALLDRSMAFYANPAKIDAYAKEYPDTVQARVLRIEEARGLLPDGMQELGSPNDKAAGVEKLKKARDIYDKYAEGPAGQRDLLLEALMNSGKVSEALGEYDRAKKSYNRLVKEYKETVQGKEAEARLKALDDPDLLRTVEYLRPSP